MSAALDWQDSIAGWNNKYSRRWSACYALVQGLYRYRLTTIGFIQLTSVCISGCSLNYTSKGKLLRFWPESMTQSMIHECNSPTVTSRDSRLALFERNRTRAYLFQTRGFLIEAENSNASLGVSSAYAYWPPRTQNLISIHAEAH